MKFIPFLLLVAFLAWIAAYVPRQYQGIAIIGVLVTICLRLIWNLWTHNG